ncbi:MAG: alpha/beta fold hydrolase, partial [Flavobacteriales bacterium]
MQDEIISEGGFNYLEKGEGKPLILLHGLFGALSNFKEVVDHFSDRYRVIIPMLPLYELPVLETSAKNLAKFLKSFLDFKE